MRIDPNQRTAVTKARTGLPSFEDIPVPLLNRDNLLMYWPHVLALALFAPSAWRFFSAAAWERDAVWAVVAVGGLVSALAPDEVSSWTGRYGWTYESFWTYPPTYVRFAGLAMLTVALLFGFGN